MGDFIDKIFLALLQKLFRMVLNVILGLFASDHILLEVWGSLIVKKNCILLKSKITYIRIVEALSKHDIAITYGRGTAWNSSQPWSKHSTECSSKFSELHSLCAILAQSVIPCTNL